MSNLSDVANFQNLDESFSNAVGDRARKLANDLKEKAQRLLNQAKEAKDKADKMAKDALKSTNQAIKDSAKKAEQHAKDLADKAKSAVKHAESERKKLNKKAKKNLKNLVGKVRGAYKKMLRRQVLSAVYLSIRANRHGIATRLYPAIIPEAQSKGFKYKSSFIAKSKKSYQEILQQWANLGGKKSKLDDAITKGARLRVFKFKRKSNTLSGATANPTHGGATSFAEASKAHPKVGFDGVVVENKDIIIGDTDFHVLYNNFSANDSAINHALNEYYSGIDADGDNIDDETGMPVETSESASVSNETLSSDENSALQEEGADSTDTVEKESAFKAFIARILSIFRRNKADEVPYEEGSADSDTYATDINSDADYQPKSGDNGDTTISNLNVSERDPLEDPNAKIEDIPELIMGVESKYVYAIGGVLAGLGLGLGIAYATKQNKLLFASIGAVALGTVGFFTPKFMKKSDSAEAEEKSEFLGFGKKKKKDGANKYGWNYKCKDEFGNIHNSNFPCETNKQQTKGDYQGECLCKDRQTWAQSCCGK